MASSSSTPPTTTDIGRTVLSVHEATADTIDPDTYQSIGLHEERYYLVAVVRERDVVDESRTYTAVYATADGYRATTRRYRCASVPHGISVHWGSAPQADELLDTTKDDLAALVAAAHPEVPQR